MRIREYSWHTIRPAWLARRQPAERAVSLYPLRKQHNVFRSNQVNWIVAVAVAVAAAAAAAAAPQQRRQADRRQPIIVVPDVRACFGAK